MLDIIEQQQALYRTRDGFVTLGPELVRIVQLLDDCFLAWARAAGADPMHFPTLIPVRDLAAIDYFENFPHLGMFVATLNRAALEERFGRTERVDSAPNTHLCCAQHALPSAACYNVYASLRNETVPENYLVTTVAACYRNETYYDGLKRLRSFRMREIVAVGDPERVREHLRASKAVVCRLAEELRIPVKIEVATDPFFEQDGQRAKMQRLFPVKEELVFDGSVAITSLNYHRNFFGERFDIRAHDGELAHSGCVGMGLERWVHALLAVYDEDCTAIEAALLRQLDRIRSH